MNNIHNFLTNKKIVFYGPAFTKDKDSLNLDTFDYVIITNNMVSIFFEKYPNLLNCKVILVTNILYTKFHIQTILQYDRNIALYFTACDVAGNILKQSISKSKIHIMGIPHFQFGIPLILTRILIFLYCVQFKELYITGATFYNATNIHECYEDPRYIIPQARKFNVFSMDSQKHNIPYNIYVARSICLQKQNITLCNELNSVIWNQKNERTILT
tara:strand:- start:1382 stop:2026 length:645 start_codon:yes stop_codon:yes gene_type:complete